MSFKINFSQSPGPWKLLNGNCNQMVGVTDAKDKAILMLGRADAINPANVNLVLAAPELLEAAKHAEACLDHIANKYVEENGDLEDVVSILQLLRSAIAKASPPDAITLFD